MSSRWFLQTLAGSFSPSRSLERDSSVASVTRPALRQDSGGQDEHMVFILLWLNQIKPDSFSSFSVKQSNGPSPSLFKIASWSRSGISPSPSLVSTASLPPRPVLELHVMDTMIAAGGGGGCPLPALGLFLSFPRCVLVPCGPRCHQCPSTLSPLLPRSIYIFATA